MVHSIKKSNRVKILELNHMEDRESNMRNEGF